MKQLLLALACLSCAYAQITVIQGTDPISTSRITINNNFSYLEGQKVPITRTITAGVGLTGGGDLSANRTISLAFPTASAIGGVISKICPGTDKFSGVGTDGVFICSADTGTGGSGHVIEDEGSALTQRSNLNFTGTGVSCADSGGKTVCTITSGTGGGVNSLEGFTDTGSQNWVASGTVFPELAGNNTYTGINSFAGAVLRIPQGTTTPATCTLGDVFFDTDATAGENVYGCTSTNTWTLMSGGTGGGGSGAANATCFITSGTACTATHNANLTNAYQFVATCVDQDNGQPVGPLNFSSVTANALTINVSGTVTNVRCTVNTSGGSTGTGSGDFVGPASSTSGNLVSFNGTTGKLGQDSGVASSAVATLTGTQTLTNKTLITPTISGTGFANANHAHAGSTSGGTIAMSALTGTASLTTQVSGTLPLANGGTNQTAWTASRCVQVNSAGTALEVASAACGTGGSGTVTMANLKTDYNAFGDGTTIDTTFVQAAATAGKSIWVPAGIYQVDAEIGLADNSRFYCDTGATFRKVTGTGSTRMFLGFGDDDVAFVGCRFDMNSVALTADGLIKMEGGLRFTFKDNHVFNASGNTNNDNHGLFLVDQSADITGSEFRNVKGFPIRMDSSLPISVTNNRCYDSNSGCVYAFNNAGMKDMPHLIANNYAENILSWFGTGEVGNAYHVYQGRHVRFIGNKAKNTGYSCIRAASADYITMEGNNCETIGETALYAEFAANYVTITGNTVLNAQKTCISGVNLDTPSFGAYYVISNNVLQNCSLITWPGSGNYAEYHHGAIQVEGDATITGNLIDGSKYGMLLGFGSVGRGLNVTNNIIRDTRGSPQMVDGIAIRANAGLSNITINHNDITGFSRKAINGHQVQTDGAEQNIPAAVKIDQFSATHAIITGTLTSAANGSRVYCTDCNIATSCTSGGSGAFAHKIAGAWTCGQAASGTATSFQSSATLPGTCTAGEVYFHTTATSGVRAYVCDSTNTWRYFITGTTSGTGVVSLLEGTAPGAGASAGEHNLYFRSSDSKLASHENGGSEVTYSQTIASGTATLGTSAISSGACATAVTVAATGVATTDVITFTPNADITAVTGYAPVTTGGLAIYPYPTSGNINFTICNPSSSSITPGAVVLNWRVTR